MMGGTVAGVALRDHAVGASFVAASMWIACTARGLCLIGHSDDVASRAGSDGNGMQIEGERSIEIRADALAVWNLVAHVENMGRWSPITTSASWVPPACEPQVGAQFRGTNRLPVVRRWTSTATVTRAVPGQVFEFAVGRDVTDPNTAWTYDFAQDDRDTTTVTERWKMLREPRIVLAYYRVINQRERIARGVEATLRHLKAAAEAG